MASLWENLGDLAEVGAALLNGIHAEKIRRWEMSVKERQLEQEDEALRLRHQELTEVKRERVRLERERNPSVISVNESKAGLNDANAEDLGEKTKSGYWGSKVENQDANTRRILEGQIPLDQMRAGKLKAETLVVPSLSAARVHLMNSRALAAAAGTPQKRAEANMYEETERRKQGMPVKWGGRSQPNDPAYKGLSATGIDWVEGEVNKKYYEVVGGQDEKNPLYQLYKEIGDDKWKGLYRKRKIQEYQELYGPKKPQAPADSTLAPK